MNCTTPTTAKTEEELTTAMISSSVVVPSSPPPCAAATTADVMEAEEKEIHRYESRSHYGKQATPDGFHLGKLRSTCRKEQWSSETRC